MSKHSVSFKHGDREGNVHEVSAIVKELGDQQSYDIDEWVSDEAREAGKFSHNLGRFAALRAAVESLEIDHKQYSLTKSKTIPRLKDPEINKTVLDHLLGYVIRYNDWLVDEEDYRATFERYILDEQEIPAEDPIKFPTRGAGTPQGQTESA